MFIRHLLQHL